MTNLIERISRGALLGLAILPLVAIAGGAHAATRVKVSDLDLASAGGVAAYEQRAAKAGRNFCSDRAGLSANAACRAGVKAELTAERDRLRQARMEQLGRLMAAR